MRKLQAFCLAAILICAAKIEGQGTVMGTNHRKVFTAGGGGGPTVVSTTSCPFSSTSPTSCSFGSALVNDIVWYTACPNNNGPTITVTVSGALASGGAVVDIATANQGLVAGACQSGHFVITTAGTATVSAAYTGGTGGTTDGNLNGGVLRSSTGLDVAATTFAPQNGSGTGANAIVSASVTTTGANRVCVASTLDQNLGGGTLTAGTTLAWTNFQPTTAFSSGVETFAKASAGAIIATFGVTANAFTQTSQACFR